MLIHGGTKVLILNIKTLFLILRDSAVCLSVISETPTIEVVTRVTGQVQLCPLQPAGAWCSKWTILRKPTGLALR